MNPNAREFDPQAFAEDGVAVVRGAIDLTTLMGWQAAWEDFYDARFGFGRKPEWNPVAINGPFPRELDAMPRYEPLLDIAGKIFGPDIALYNHRFVVKDEYAREAVMLHHDTPYHVGWPQKASFFIALSEMTDGNGAMRFYEGSHKLGYLGDAGELSRACMAKAWVQLTACAGDVIVMHSACWHESAERFNGPDRVLADILLQPASDPSGRELLRGQWQCVPQPWLHSPHLFVRSRVSRIRELEGK